jgi:hypothetical protein
MASCDAKYGKEKMPMKTGHNIISVRENRIRVKTGGGM